MNIYPAIDLKDGKCVRLLRGDMTAATVFNANPASQAQAFQAAGFKKLHLVDLNGAFEGKAVNGDAVRSILSATASQVQLGGGIRDEEDVVSWLDAGLHRVILGTLALRQPALAADLCRRYPGQVAIGIDARDGKVAVEGWAEQSDVQAVDLARRFEDAGAAAIIYTDIDRDGAMQGANVDATASLAEQISTPVIVSGGVSNLADLGAVKAAAGSGIEGVIIGRALYDGVINPVDALAIAAGV